MKLHKSILAAVLGLGLALGFGIGATELHASAQAAIQSSADAGLCPASACPVEVKASCAGGTKSAQI